ncbi:Uncharacterised protein [Citrobacter braakii]|nr:Uncharacterised protein [Citrobacter braakii]
MTNNVLNAVIDDFVRYRNGLFRIAGVVIFDGNQFVAFDPAFGIDIFNGLTCAIKFHITPLRDRT